MSPYKATQSRCHLKNAAPNPTSGATARPQFPLKKADLPDPFLFLFARRALQPWPGALLLAWTSGRARASSSRPAPTRHPLMSAHVPHNKSDPQRDSGPRSRLHTHRPEWASTQTHLQICAGVSEKEESEKRGRVSPAAAAQEARAPSAAAGASGSFLGS